VPVFLPICFGGIPSGYSRLLNKDLIFCTLDASPILWYSRNYTQNSTNGPNQKEEKQIKQTMELNKRLQGEYFFSSLLYELNEKAGYCKITASTKHIDDLLDYHYVFLYQKHWRYTDAIRNKYITRDMRRCYVILRIS